VDTGFLNKEILHPLLYRLEHQARE